MKKFLANNDISTGSLFVRFVLVFLLMVVVLFGSAGSFYWPEAWIYIVLQLSISAAITLWLKEHDPELLRSRISLLKPTIRGRDKFFAVLFMVMYIPYLLLPGLDAKRFHWFQLPLAVELLGFAGIIASMWLLFRVMQVNSFASTIVELQPERGHQVIDVGPYAYVRHPMYSGFIVCLVSVPLALGSLWTVPLALIISLSFLIRIYFEESVLCLELEGYQAYLKKVPFRLVPGLW